MNLAPLDSPYIRLDLRSGDGRRLREHINKLCREHKGPSYVLLVGAIDAGRLTEAEKKVLPALSGTIGRMKGQPSDNGYGCLDEGRSYWHRAKSP